MTKEIDGTVRISLHGVPPEGQEKHIGDHMMRDLVRFAHGRSMDEMACCYARLDKRKAIKLVETIDKGEKP